MTRSSRRGGAGEGGDRGGGRGFPAGSRRSRRRATLGREPRGGSMNENDTKQSPWGGWLLHAVIGTGVTAVLAWLGAPPVAVLGAVLAMGIAHEIGDGGFLRGNGGAGNGGGQVLAFFAAGAGR